MSPILDLDRHMMQRFYFTRPVPQLTFALSRTTIQLELSIRYGSTTYTRSDTNDT